MPIVIEKYEEFVARQGGNGIKVDQRILFPNGATADCVDGRWRTEPPTEAFALLHAKRRYLVAQYERARQRFIDAQQSLVELASNALDFGNLPVPPQDSPHELLKLKKVAEGWNKKLRAIDADIAASPRGVRRRELQRRRDVRDQEIRDVRSKIMAIHLEGEPAPTDEDMPEGLKIEAKLMDDALARAAGVKKRK